MNQLLRDQTEIIKTAAKDVVEQILSTSSSTASESLSVGNLI